jgi:drug/metabolite transporter (DMT)-like permease
MNYYILLPFLIAFIWGLSPIVFKYIITKDKTPTYLILFIQAVVYLFACLIYIIFWKQETVHEDISRHSKWIPLISLTSLMSIFVANLLFLYTLEKGLHVNIVNIISALYPVVTVIFAYFILNETLTYRQIIGFIITMIGITLLLYDEKNMS